MRPERLFRWLLRLLPADLRADHGREMERDFRDEHRDARGGGRVRVAAVWYRTLADLARTGPREHARQIAQDGSYALRMMRRTPGFTLVAVLTLALGIGVNSAIFSLVHAVLLQPLPYAGEDALVAVWNRWDGSPAASLSDPEFMDYDEQARSLHLAALDAGSVNLADAGEPERVDAAFVSPDLLPVLGVSPVLGRGFAEQEEREGAPRVAILAHGLWTRRFHGDRSVIGRALRIDGQPVEVVGVAPAGLLLPTDFRSGVTAQILLPLTLDRAAPRDRRGGHYLEAVARLRPGASLDGARAEMDAVVARLIQQHPDQHKQGHFGVTVTPLRSDLLGPARPILGVLLGAVSLVLLLACANLASLLLARGEARRRELAVRASLGADRFRLVRQLLTETCVLGLLGGAAGLAVAAATMKALQALDPGSLPRAQEAALSLSVVAFTAAASLGAGLLFGLLPALQISRVALDHVLREAGRSSTGGRGRLRRALVAGQVAIALVLLAGSGLLVKSFARLRNVATGFEPAGVLTFRTSAPAASYPGRPEVTAFYARLLEQVRAVPGVRVAGAGSGLPLSVHSGDWGFDVEGRVSVPGQRPRADWFAVTPGYFEALGVRVVSGRLPAEGDDGERAPVIFLNHSAARSLFPGEDPLGRRVRLSRTTGAEQPWRTVAGVVSDVRQRGLERPPRPEMYVPLPQFQHFMAGTQARNMTVVAKVDGAPLGVAASMRAALRRVDPEVPAAQMRAMDEVVGTSMAARRRDTWLIGAFAALALAVATVGVYGVIAYHVAQRRREIGLRLAIGAERSDVVRMVLAQGTRLAGAGILAGLPVALLASAALRPLLFDVAPHDASVFAAIAVLLMAVAAMACALPAARAAHIDPAVALRDE
jgi:putative ABC transport system permease protein